MTKRNTTVLFASAPVLQLIQNFDQFIQIRYICISNRVLNNPIISDTSIIATLTEIYIFLYNQYKKRTISYIACKTSNNRVAFDKFSNVTFLFGTPTCNCKLYRRRHKARRAENRAENRRSRYTRAHVKECNE